MHKCKYKYTHSAFVTRCNQLKKDTNQSHTNHVVLVYHSHHPRHHQNYFPFNSKLPKFPIVSSLSSSSLSSSSPSSSSSSSLIMVKMSIPQNWLLLCWQHSPQASRHQGGNWFSPAFYFLKKVWQRKRNTKHDMSNLTFCPPFFSLFFYKITCQPSEAYFFVLKCISKQLTFASATWGASPKWSNTSLYARHLIKKMYRKLKKLNFFNKGKNHNLISLPFS